MRSLKHYPKLMTGLLVTWLLGLVLALVFTQSRADTPSSSQTVDGAVKKPQNKPKQKSQEEKETVMQLDLSTMSSYGLYYDYANLSLVEVVQAYLTEFGIDQSQVAFSYKNMETGELFGMNQYQPMTAGSTYKLPLNMLIVDGVAEGKFSMKKAYDISTAGYEYLGEHQAYLAQFGTDMTISEMQEYSLLHSENTPAYAMAKMLGGMEKAYAGFDRYGQAREGAISSIKLKGNQTTTDYYIQVLEYLYHNQDKYKDILYYIGASFPGDFAKIYLPNVTIYQKPGYYAEAINVDAIVMEEQPYLVAIYTAYLGGASPERQTVSVEGVIQLGQLAYVINEWHRVNRNVPMEPVLQP